MTLLFDLFATQPNPTGKRHGGGKYGEFIFFCLVKRKCKFLCAYDKTIWLNPEVESACRFNGIELIDISGDKWQEVVNTYKVDLIYSCLPYHLTKVRGCKIIGTLHGLRGIETPYDIFNELMYFKSKPLSLLRCLWHELKNTRRDGARNFYKKIMTTKEIELVTVSNHSKYSMLSQYPELPVSKIKVFYSPSTSSEQGQKKKIIEEKYFLMVSANRPDKNNLRAVIAFDRLFSTGFLQDYKVILTGFVEEKSSWIKERILGKCDMGNYRIKNKDKFIFKGYVSDNELNDLYANAYCFVYPSLNEGFGYPPLEAMSYGTPVIASAIASIPEVLDNAALYFTPFSIEEIMNRILQISDKEYHQHYSEAGKERYLFVKSKQEKDLDALVDLITSEEEK